MVMISNNIVSDPPFPWIKVGVALVGGLYQVGFARHRDLVMVHSASKLSLIDTTTGARIAEERTSLISDEDCLRLVAPGFDVIAGETIVMAGIWGGGLRRTTSDGYYLNMVTSKWPVADVCLSYPDGREILVSTHNVSTIHAYGFSETGGSFVIATDSDLQIFTRLKEAA